MLLLGNKGKCRCSFTYAQFSAYNEVKNKYYMHVLLKGGGGVTLWERCWDASFNEHKMFNVWNIIKSISQKMRPR